MAAYERLRQEASEAAAAGDVAAFARLPRFFQKGDNALVAAVEREQYEFLEWYQRNVMPKWNWKWCRAASQVFRGGSYKKAAEWLIRKFPQHRRTILLNVATLRMRHGDVETLEWANEVEDVTPDILVALSAGHLRVLDWYWQNNRCPGNLDVGTVGASGFRRIAPGVLKWLSDRNLVALRRDGPVLLSIAMRTGHVAMLDWLEGLGAAGPQEVAKVGRLHEARMQPGVAEWLKQRGL